ncbi:MAG: hypothetical protein IH840_07755, partial [Candidatus Heimdallarchaeota archaeon]|nr:hypothetical protein [Candidatus Heimdallarchaeota archaeon]
MNNLDSINQLILAGDYDLAKIEITRLEEEKTKSKETAILLLLKKSFLDRRQGNLHGALHNANHALNLVPSDDYYLISADWTPVGDVHSCVNLSIHGVANDVNTENNWTQENISEFTTTPGSPYEPVTTRFTV